MGLTKSITFQMESANANISEMIAEFDADDLTESLGTFARLFLTGIAYNATYTDVTGTKPPISILNPITRVKALSDAVQGKGIGVAPVASFTSQAKYVYLPSGAPVRMLVGVSENETFTVGFTPTIPDQAFSGILPASYKFNFYCTIFFEIENN